MQYITQYITHVHETLTELQPRPLVPRSVAPSSASEPDSDSASAALKSLSSSSPSSTLPSHSSFFSISSSGSVQRFRVGSGLSEHVHSSGKWSPSYSRPLGSRRHLLQLSQAAQFVLPWRERRSLAESAGRGSKSRREPGHAMRPAQQPAVPAAPSRPSRRRPSEAAACAALRPALPRLPCPGSCSRAPVAHEAVRAHLLCSFHRDSTMSGSEFRDALELC